MAIEVAYTLGWRMQSEVLTLERSQFDPDAGTLRPRRYAPAIALITILRSR